MENRLIWFLGLPTYANVPAITETEARSQRSRDEQTDRMTVMKSTCDAVIPEIDTQFHPRYVVDCRHSTLLRQSVASLSVDIHQIVFTFRGDIIEFFYIDIHPIKVSMIDFDTALPSMSSAKYMICFEG